jgi:hypothetical protein
MNYVLCYKISSYIGTSFEVLCTVFKHSLIAYYELTTLPCINLIYVSFMYCIYKLLLLLLFVFVFYCQDSFCSVPTFSIMTSSISTLVDLWNTE